MKDEAFEIIKGIAIVILISTIAIFLCLRLLDKNYIYRLKYYHGDNLYTLNITADYEIRIDVQLVCTDEKCVGDKKTIISTSNAANKNDVKKLIEIMNLKPHTIIETNENIVSDKQKEIINKIIG